MTSRFPAQDSCKEESMEKRPDPQMPFSGRRLLWGCLLLLFCLPGPLAAAEYRIDSQTLFRFFERDTFSGADQAVIPAYEYLQADVGSLQEKGLSFHFYGWGRYDFADNDYYDDADAGEILYGYARYNADVSNLDLRLGRQYIFEGVASDAVDGLRVATDLGRYLTLSAYAGQPVSLDAVDGRDGDSIYGGRLGHRLGSRCELGLSYKAITNDSDLDEQRLGLDLSLFFPTGVSLSGFTVYNLETDGFGEHSYDVRFTVGSFDFRPFYQRFDYEDYFSVGKESANPFRFLAGTGEILSVYGADAVLHRFADVDLGLKVKLYDYDKRGDASQYYAGVLTWHGKDLTSLGGELGVMSGDASENKYILARGFFYWDQLQPLPGAFVSGDVVYVAYDRAIYADDDSSLFLSLGVGSKFLKDALELKLSGDYSVDPYFDNDLRGLLVASFAFGR
jgi:hypothetical protein